MPIAAHTTSRPTRGSRTKPAALAALLLAATAAFSAGHAEELRPLQAKSLHLGDVTGIVYYAVHDQGFQVVATLASPDDTPVRFESILLPGQKLVVSIPGPAGAKAQTAEFVRQGDRLLVEASPVQYEEARP